MKKIIGLIALCAGLLFALYPVIHNEIERNNNISLIEEYENKINNIKSEEKQLIVKSAQEYNSNLQKNKLQSTSYDSIISVSGIMGYIEIPKIDIYLPIYHGTTDFILEKGIGHLEGSSLPVGGDGTNCVLTGHTGMAKSKLFTDLDKLKENDVFYIHILDEIHAYKVDNIKIVLPSELDFENIKEDKDYITLMTCTPYGINTHRLLIRGTRIPYNNELPDNYSGNNRSVNVITYKKSVYEKYICLSVIGITLFVSAVIIAICIKKRKNKDCK